jgi:hypothetical protein
VSFDRPERYVARGIANALAKELAGRPGWDEYPVLYAVQLTPEHDCLRLGHFPFTDEVWEGGGGAVGALRLIGEALALTPPGERPLPPGGDLYAVAFRTEAWSVPDSEPGTAQASEDAADAMGHRLKHRPDRIEIRCCSAVDIRGVSYEVEQPRGGVPSYTLGEPRDDGEPNVHSGAVFDALDRILLALTGTKPPVRRHA